jgi:hypothetical protein
MLAEVLCAAAFFVLAGVWGRGFAPQPAPAPEATEAEADPAPATTKAEADPAPAGAGEPEGEPDAAAEEEAEEEEDEDARWAPDPATAARLRGKILSFGEREPLGEARLIFKDGRPSQLVGSDGSFTVMLPPGRHELIVRAPGFRDLPAAVELQPRQDLEVELRLDSELDNDVYRTVVTAERQVAVSSTTLRGDELRRVPGTRGDPLRGVGSLPGVGQLAGFLPYVVVRGAAPGNTGYYLDGSRVPILFHVAIGPSVIHPYFIDAVDFYPSGAPVRLGRYTSGIIEARTRPARRDRLHGDVDLRLTDAGALLEIPIDRRILPGCTHETKRRRRCKKGPARGALTLAGRYSYTGAVLTLVQSDARIRFWDYQARFDHRLGETLDFTAFAYGSFDDLGQKAFTDPDTGERVQPDPFLRFQFHRLDSRIRQRLRRDGTAVYAVVLGLDQTGFGGGNPLDEPSADGDPGAGTNEWRVAPRADFRVPVTDAVALDFGLDQEVQFFRLRNPLEDLTDVGNIEDLALLFSEREVVATGIYFDVEVKKNRVEVRPGARLDFFVQSGSSPYLPRARGVTHAVGIDPRLLLRERVAKRWWLKQAVGVYHQAPSFPIPIPGIESFGFERGLQRNIQGSFGYEVTIVEDLLTLSQEAYLGRLSNLQDYELGGATGDSDVEELEDVIARVDGWAYGLETLLKLEPSGKIFGWAAYTLSRSTREYAAGGSAPSNWDQRHIVNLVLGYWISGKWNLGGRVHYHTGRPWTAPLPNQDVADALAENRNNARLPPFFQLDLRLERVWRWPNWQLSASLDVANATYSREVFACTPDENEGGTIEGALRSLGLAARRMAAANGVAACTPQGFRYVIPSLGLRARW